MPKGPSVPRFRFLRGLILGMLIGIAVGWFVRPPSSFKLDELRDATEKKLDRAGVKARKELAKFAEDWARKLRESAATDSTTTPPAISAPAEEKTEDVTDTEEPATEE
jgi:gas vesicle protein